MALPMTVINREKYCHSLGAILLLYTYTYSKTTVGHGTQPKGVLITVNIFVVQCLTLLCQIRFKMNLIYIDEIDYKVLKLSIH